MAQDMPKQEGDNAPTREELIELTSGVVAAYVSNNSLPTADLPDLIGTVYGRFSALGAGSQPEVEQKPAVPIKRSVGKQTITCLECGKQQKTLKRHLNTAHGLTPDEYRAKWRLSRDYPMVAPDYAEKRRSLAKQIGLGRTVTKAPAKRKASPRKKS